MILSDKKYVDPLPVINSIADENGNYISIGDPKDVGEFNISFLARVEEGLKQQEARNKYIMKIESDKDSITIIIKKYISKDELSTIDSLFSMKCNQIISFTGEGNKIVKKNINQLIIKKDFSILKN